MRYSPIILFHFLLLPLHSVAAEIINDSISASSIYATVNQGNISRVNIIGHEKIRTSASISDAIRIFSGVQLKDYGGAGGLKTVNIRSLGSQHTGVFVDGLQVDNAQNMQVDLGRFSTDNIRTVSIINGQKTDWLQSAKEYGVASAIYIESGEPVLIGRKANFRARLRGGSFGTFSGALTFENKLSPRISIRLNSELLFSDGQYRFHVKDFRKMPDGAISGYDTVMIRKNCDIRSFRIESQIFGNSADGSSRWNIQLYDYDSERGLPGPVYKIAGKYPLSSDRQADNNFFLQGTWKKTFSKSLAMSVKGKYSFDWLRFLDFSETDASVEPADYKYANNNAYGSVAVLWSPKQWWKLNFAADYQLSALNHNKFPGTGPVRHSFYGAAASSFYFSRIKISASILYNIVNDINGNKSEVMDCLTPSVVFNYRPFKDKNLIVNGFVRRSFRIPTFNDLYYVTAVVKSLRPENAWQSDIGADYSIGLSGNIKIGLGAEAYYNKLRDKIIAVPVANQFRWSMYNIGIVDILGYDIKWSADYDNGKFSAGVVARYTFQKASDKSSPGEITFNGQIPYIPLHSGSLSIYCKYGGWRADADFFFTGERFSASSNLQQFRLEPWATGDISLTKKIKLPASEFNLHLNIRNLLNSSYEIVDNYPMPGINFLAGIEYIF